MEDEEDYEDDDYYEDEDDMEYVVKKGDWKTHFDEYFKGQEESCANVAILSKDNVLHCINNTACHAGLSCMRKFTNNMQMIISRPTEQNGYTEEDLILFADWMVNESPWKDVFLNPNGEHVAENYWWVSPDHNAEFVVNACIATRLISEFPDRFRIWKASYESGMSGTEAYICAMLFTGGKDHYFYPQRGHSIAQWSTKETIRRLASHTPHFYREEAYQEVGNYQHNNSVWDGGGVSDDWGSLYEQYKIINSFKPQEVVKVKNLNIFFKEKFDGKHTYFKSADLPSIFKQVKEKFIA